MPLARCVVLDDYQGAALRLADWTRLAGSLEIETIPRHIADREELRAVLAGALVVVANRERTRLDAALLEALPDLELIVTTGMANAAIDVAAARRLGKLVCGTGSAGNSAAELAWALILATAREVSAEATNLAAGGWQKSVGMGLAGKTLGLLGLGRVGQRVARVAAAFEMEVLAWTPSLDEARAAALGVRRAPTLDLVFAQSDVVSLHLPLNAGTRGLVDAEKLALMRPHAILVNTARGPIVEEAALIDALRAGRIAGAGLDVFDIEPLPLDHPFRTLERVVATPHLGYVTEDNFRRYFGDAVEDIAAWLAGAPIRIIAP